MSCFPPSNSTRICSRFLCSVTLGTIVIMLFSMHLKTFDNTSALGLFSSVVVVASEDVSLGPVLWKGFLRCVGSLVGGIVGFVLLFLPRGAYPSMTGKRLFLVIIPTILVTTLIWLSKGGYSLVSEYVKDKKIFHAIQFGIVSFGTVYIGSWDISSGDHALRVAVVRTSSVFLGCLIVMLSSIIAFPITSMSLCSKELSSSLKTLGELAKNICDDRNSGEIFHPSQPQFGQLSLDDDQIVAKNQTMADNHIKLFKSIDTKVAKVEALIPFFHMEPSWAPGLPTTLIGKGKLLHSHLGLFISMITGRLNRIRSSLVAMDVNTRIDSSDRFKEVNEKVVSCVGEIGQSMLENLTLVGNFIESPFVTDVGWQGDKSLRQSCVTAVDTTKSKLLILTKVVNDSIEKYNSLLQHDRNDVKITPKQLDFDSKYPATFRYRLGNEIMDNWHKIFPMRAFCNMTYQVAMQVCGLVLEVVSYIDKHYPDATQATGTNCAGTGMDVEHESASSTTLCPPPLLSSKVIGGNSAQDLETGQNSTTNGKMYLEISTSDTNNH